jgi:hypothetical protein
VSTTVTTLTTLAELRSCFRNNPGGVYDRDPEQNFDQLIRAMLRFLGEKTTRAYVEQVVIRTLRPVNGNFGFGCFRNNPGGVYDRDPGHKIENFDQLIRVFYGKKQHVRTSNNTIPAVINNNNNNKW